MRLRRSPPRPQQHRALLPSHPDGAAGAPGLLSALAALKATDGGGGGGWDHLSAWSSLGPMLLRGLGEAVQCPRGHLLGPGQRPPGSPGTAPECRAQLTTEDPAGRQASPACSLHPRSPGGDHRLLLSGPPGLVLCPSCVGPNYTLCPELH